MNVRILQGFTALAVIAATTMSAQIPSAWAAVGQPSAVAAQQKSARPAPYVSATAAASWQTNGTVWAIAYAKGTVYVGGQFTSVRPPRDKPGTGGVARTYLAAFSSATGALISSFNATITGASGSEVSALAVSPDGKTLYVGGLFSHVDGAYRDNLAALSTSTGQLTGWAPTASGKVNAIALNPRGSEIYVGGSFTRLDGQARPYAGAVGIRGRVQPWAPVLNHAVTSLAVSPDDLQVLVGGYFQTINGVTQNAAGGVDPVTGTTTEPWTANIVPWNPPACTSSVKDIVISGSTAYLAAEGTGGSCFDGDYAVKLGAPTRKGGKPSDTLLWQNDCLGATQSLAVIDGTLFKGSHAHDCAYAPGGFPQNPETSGPYTTYHLLSQSLTDGSLGHWTPDTTSQNGGLGPRAMATDGRQLFLGGDFTTVNGAAQQGLARFPAGPDTATPPRPAAPAVTSPVKGVALVTFPAVSTRDVGSLTYKVYRSGSSAAIGEVTATSWPWALPVVHYRATGLRPGATYTFGVAVGDGTRESRKSPGSAPVTISGTPPPPRYQPRVLYGKPSFFWVLNQSSGHVATDSSPNHFNGVYMRGITHRVGGPILGSTATATGFNGLRGLVTSAAKVTSPQTFSIEAWFKTTTNTGGKIIGFGSSQAGRSSSYDRQVYMMNDGQLVFGMTTPQRQVIETPNVYNDGQWHYVVAMFSSATSSSNMTLYVDGQRIGALGTGAASSYAGYWRVGGDNLSGWNLDYWGSNSQRTTEPNSYYFRGSIGDVAVYPYVLSAARIAAHYATALSR